MPNDSVPEIITVNSEALQTQIRDLLPSQAGFGSELQASNVITPIVDLTAAAEGSGLATYLQTAIAFGSQTVFNVSNATTTLLDATGFFRVFGVANNESGSGIQQLLFQLSDGSSTKNIWKLESNGSSTDFQAHLEFDFIVFLRAGDSLIGLSNNAACTLVGSTRQVATGDGTLIQPNGFPL